MLVQNSTNYSRHHRHLPSYPNTNTPHHSDTSFWNQPQSSLQQLQSYNNNNNNIYSFGNEQSHPVFDFPTQNLRIQVQPELMQSEQQQQQQSNSWLSNGQLTPTSATPRAYHHRESSLSSLGSAGPASPYNPTTSNPHVALSTDPVDVYYELHDQSQYHAKPLTPAHTPSQEHFLAHQYSRLNSQNFNNDFNHHDFSQLNMSNEALPRQQTMGDSELMPAPEFTNSGRPSVVSVASHESPSTPPTFDEERRKTAEYRSTMPKLDRTMTDVYQDELYNPSFQITSAPPSRPLQSIATLSPAQNDIFTQRLQAANNQHLNSQTPLNIPSRERSPFRQGSPLAPSANSFGSQKLPNMRLGTASGMREQQKAENDAMALQQQLDRTSPSRHTPNTISPKDVDLVYHENEEDAGMPLFPKQEQQSPQQYRPRTQTQMKREPDVDDGSSQQSFGSMATSRRESSSNYSTSSQATPQASAYNFAQPAVPQNMRQLPQQYPFISQSQRQPSTVSSATDDFPATLTSMDSSSSEYAPDTGAGEIKKPARTSADSGTYTCTYHNCTLRFDTPAKLQRHKREGHRQSANVVGGDEAEALRNTQAGPHKCERINPSTGKPCNTIFSRPYDLTRHEDTIHNARKQKIRCNLCTEEKTFSRADALTRHYKVVHPEQILPTKSRRRGGAD